VSEITEDNMSIESIEIKKEIALQIDPASAEYNIAEYAEIHGVIDVGRFEQALQQVVKEAEAIRVCFSENSASGAVQQTIAPVRSSLQVMDVSAGSEPRSIAETWMKADRVKPIDLTHGPLFTFALFRVAADQFIWYHKCHHIANDAFGGRLVARRLAEVYTELESGFVTSSEPFDSFSELLSEEAAYRASEQFIRDKQYWLEHFQDRPEPTSLAVRHLTEPTDGALRSTSYLSSSTADALSEIAKRTGVSWPQVLIAIAAGCIFRLTGENEVIIGLLRSRAQSENRTTKKTTRVAA